MINSAIVVTVVIIVVMMSMIMIMITIMIMIMMILITCIIVIIFLFMCVIWVTTIGTTETMSALNAGGYNQDIAGNCIAFPKQTLNPPPI